MAATPLQRLASHGQSPWIDFLSRDFIRHGGLERAVREDAIAGVTSNPTIFQRAISTGSSYDEQIRGLLPLRSDPKEVFLELAGADCRAACDALRGLWHGATGRDGWVSLEVDPGLAHEAEASLLEARRLRELVERPNLFVKIPATEAGLRAVEEAIAEGIPVNVTLIFSLRRYAQVAAAYVRGLERLSERRERLDGVGSVASFFVSRVDTEGDRRLEQLGAPRELRGRLAVANARLAYALWKDIFSGPRWKRLAERGAAPQRCLWASTSVKNPDYRDVMYVEELIGPETVSTMPADTIRAFQDHGRAEPTLERGLDEARALLDEVRAAGLDYDELTAALEEDGVRLFVESYEGLLEDIERKRAELAEAA